MDCTLEPLTLTLREPFRISRSVQTTAENVRVRISAGGSTGVGEAAPSRFYGETRATVTAALPLLCECLGDDPFLLENISQTFSETFHHGNAAARAALDMALFDLIGNSTGLPVYRLLGLDPARTPVSSFTIGIDTPANMARKAIEAESYPILKIKLGTDHDLDIVRAVREVSSARIRVDANAAWSAKEAIRNIEQLAAFGIEFVEQPVAAHDLAGLKFVRDNVSIPIFADESCVTFEDVAHVAACVDGINIKLMKCGGILPALKMIHAARSHGLKIMLGCMIESSIAITAAAHLSPLVDYADLDGPLLVSDDPYDGVQYEHGKLILPDAPGLGVRVRMAG